MRRPRVFKFTANLFFLNRAHTCLSSSLGHQGQSRPRTHHPGPFPCAYNTGVRSPQPGGSEKPMEKTDAASEADAAQESFRTRDVRSVVSVWEHDSAIGFQEYIMDFRWRGGTHTHTRAHAPTTHMHSHKHRGQCARTHTHTRMCVLPNNTYRAPSPV